eukprot:3797508-Rhodomonas_salina.1
MARRFRYRGLQVSPGSTLPGVELPLLLTVSAARALDHDGWRSSGLLLAPLPPLSLSLPPPAFAQAPPGPPQAQAPLCSLGPPFPSPLPPLSPYLLSSLYSSL